MAGGLTISTLNDSSGVLATQNGMTGISKAWLCYNGTTQTILGSFNVSSVTRNGTGDYTMNFTTAMPNANYAVAGMARNNDNNNDTYIVQMQLSSTKTTSAFQFTARENGGTGQDTPECDVVVFR